jgi:hypothetical protein
VVSYEIIHADRLRESLRTGDGIMLAPNHCRYADPLVMGWLAREVRTHVYAMASWHLFNKSWFDAFAIPKMGGFSIWREGRLDRPAIETAVDVLAKAERPLMLFPEGSAHRTNDQLQPLLDGVSFIARTAARRRKKDCDGRVQILPIGIKYVFQGDIHIWAKQSLEDLERRLTWRPRLEADLVDRVARLAEGWLAVKEIEFLGRTQVGSLCERQTRLIDAVLEPMEVELQGEKSTGAYIPRVKALRPLLVPNLLAPETSEPERNQLRQKLQRLDFAQQLAAYPDGYLTRPPVTETRLLETLERMEEDLLDRPRWPGPLHVVIEVGNRLEVPPEKAPRGDVDPLIEGLAESLSEMLNRLQYRSRILDKRAR